MSSTPSVRGGRRAGAGGAHRGRGVGAGRPVAHGEAVQPRTALIARAAEAAEAAESRGMLVVALAQVSTSDVARA